MRVTVLLVGNAVGFKRKPLVVHNAENPRAMKNLIKRNLPVHYKSNGKAWMTASLFNDWFLNDFVPEVRRYCTKIGIPFKPLLIIDNAIRHPASLNDRHPDVDVVFMPPNTTSLIQPMDQGAIASFKKLYLRQAVSHAIFAVDSGDQNYF